MKIVAFFLLTLVYTSVMAQENIALLQMGVGTYSMKTQKQFQQEYLNQSRIPYKAVHKFPPYYTYGASAGTKITGQSTAGLWFNYASTGGSLDYRDYSGYSRIDQLLICYQYGVFYQYQIAGDARWSLFSSAHASAIFSTASFKKELGIGNTIQSAAMVFKSINFGLRPGLTLQRKIKAIVLQAHVGYELQLHGQLKTKDGLDFTTPLGTRVAAEWDGFRANMGVGFNIGSRK